MMMMMICDVFPKSTNSMENHWGWRGFGFLPSFQILIETRPGRHCWWLCILRRLTFLLLTKNGTGYVEANGAHEKHDRQIMKIHLFRIPKQSMYGIFTHISNKNKPNVGKYAVHGEILESPVPYGKTPWILVLLVWCFSQVPIQCQISDVGHVLCILHGFHVCRVWEEILRLVAGGVLRHGAVPGIIFFGNTRCFLTVDDSAQGSTHPQTHQGHLKW